MITYGIYLKVGDYLFTDASNPRGVVNQIEIDDSWDTYTNTARITIPKNIRYGTKDESYPVINPTTKQPIFQPGDPVEIGVMYTFNGEITINTPRKIRFRGFLNHVRTTKPMVLECEDAMRTLKRTTACACAEKDITLPQLLEIILPDGFLYQAEELTLGDVRIPGRKTITEVLEWLKKSYGLISFIRNEVLVVGFPYLTALQADLRKKGEGFQQTAKQFLGLGEQFAPDPVIIEYGKNLIDDKNLVYVTKDQNLIKLQVIVYYDVSSPRHPDGSSAKVPKKVKYGEDDTKDYFGDKDGDLRTMYMYDVPASEARRFGEEQLKKFKYEGFTGKFETFLVPAIESGGVVELRNPNVPDQEGRYWVRSVDISYGMDGGRQMVELDRKVSEDE